MVSLTIGLAGTLPCEVLMLRPLPLPETPCNMFGFEDHGDQLFDCAHMLLLLDVQGAALQSGAACIT